MTTMTLKYILTRCKGRSSTEEQRDNGEEDTTVVEPEQNNGSEALVLLWNMLTL